MAEWFSDESYWQVLYPVLFPVSRFEAAEEEVNKILALTSCPGKNVLDLCSGPGRHSVAFAKRGFQVTGVDRTPFLMEKAKQYAAQEKMEIEWVLQDMREFVRPMAYDLAVNMFTSIGYFENKDEDCKVFANIFQSLKPSGICLIDVMGKEKICTSFQETSSRKLSDGSIFIERHEFVEEWTRLDNEWIFIQDGKAKTFRFKLTIYSGQELKDRLQAVGFQEVKLFGSLDGMEYGPKGQRLIAVAKKP